ncbi:MAG: sulfatase [Candidatus Omnitrophota bacterium]
MNNAIDSFKHKVNTMKNQHIARTIKIKNNRSGNLANKYNVILISIDTLRADHLSCYGYERNTSPYIDEFSQRCALFTNAFSTSAWTVPAHASLFTGMYASRLGLVQSPRPGILPEEIKTLAEILNQSGYNTAGFHGGGYVSANFGFNRGFSTYRSKGSRFEDNLRDCFGWLERHKKLPFFLFLHGFNCHVPFNPPRKFDIYSKGMRSTYNTNRKSIYAWEPLKNKEDLEFIIAKYDGEIKYTDFLIKKVVQKLEELHLIEKTIIIITSDHGEEFMEHGQLGHIRTLYEELIRIPLLVYIPFINSGKKIDKVVSLVDIPATILEILDAKYKHTSDGRSLLSLIKTSTHNSTSFVISETGKDPNKNIGDLPPRLGYEVPEFIRCVRTNEWKLILDKDNNPIELYCISKDPKERENVCNLELSMRDELYKLSKNLNLKSFREMKTIKESDINIDKIKHQLVALGYM